MYFVNDGLTSGTVLEINLATRRADSRSLLQP